MSSRPLYHLSPVAAGLLLWAAGAGAQAVDERWALCPPPASRPEIPRLAQEATNISADQAAAEGENRSIFTGDVVVIRDGRRLGGDEAVYDKRTDTLDVTGNVEFHSDAISFTAESAHLNLTQDSGRIESASYNVPEAHASGTADQVEILSPQRTELHGATYTTCPPEDPTWRLDANTLTLDRATNTGEAYNVTLQVGSVPVFWLPYMNFPLEGRKSGFLIPSYGSSERNGTDVQVPWYWNIAPNRDATITPRLISERGGMLMTEYRYLDPNYHGEVAVDVLPDDALYGDDRSYVRLNHGHRFGERWSAALNFQEVSDPNYLNDIDNTLTSASATYLERRFDLNYRGDGWRFLGRLQDFQPLVLGSDSYQRWPQLLATGSGREERVRYDFSTEYVNFESDERRPKGSRVDLYPGVSMPLSGAAWFVTPRLAARHTHYELIDATGDDTPSRTLPIASVDSGLFFERETSLFETPLVQTLEPRLYYLYVPYEDQNDLPVFDTTAATFSFSQLFRENRFTGADRHADANQVTAALTSRLLRDDNGAEVVRASIGQIYYFDDRRVLLPGQAQDARDSSDVAGELAARPLSGLEISAATRWDPETEDAQESSARIRYRPDARHAIDAAWRYRNAGAEMNRDILVLWPLTRRWHFVGRWYYDLVAERTLENVVGLEYESCCWSFRAVTRDKPFLDDAGELQSDRSIYFTLELKGLANIGRSLESVIEDGMVGL